MSEKKQNLEDVNGTGFVWYVKQACCVGKENLRPQCPLDETE